jgi:hypothetical protein
MKKRLTWKTIKIKKEYLEGLKKSKKFEATLYDKENDHSLGDFIEHTKFGEGFIQNVINQTKIEVFFENDVKILLQNWK